MEDSMTRALALALLPLLAAAPALADEMACAGALGPDTTLSKIEETYGKANVVTGEVDGPEGTTMVATTVFPKDPDKSFQIYWWDEEKHERIAGFDVPANSTGPLGLKIGMPIADVQALNGEAFTLSGFYWDYGGSAGFDKGKLSNLPGGCFLNLTFNPSVDPPNDTISNAISGEQDLRSDMKEFAVVKPVVQGISLGYADPLADEEGDPSEEDSGGSSGGE
jgi:hypothetical protein